MSNNLISEYLKDFTDEAIELLENAENKILKYSKSQNKVNDYNDIFRTFHNIKGAAGAVGLKITESHMHKIENFLCEFNNEKEFFCATCLDYILLALDYARYLIQNEQLADFQRPKAFSYKQRKDLECFKESILHFELNNNDHQILNSFIPLIDETKVTSKPINLPKTEDHFLKEIKPLFYVVDDEPDCLEVIVDSLSAMDFEIKTFSNGNDLLKEMKIRPAQVILTDISMPVMDGYELALELIKEKYDCSIVFISGGITKTFMKNALAHNITFFIDKPFVNTQLILTAQSALTQYRLNNVLKFFMKHIKSHYYEFSNYLNEKHPNILPIYQSEIQELMKTTLMLRPNINETA